MRTERHWLLPIAALLLTGCVAYQPKPLPQAPDWAAAPLGADGRVLHTLDLDQASALALRDNPDYRAQLLTARISALDLRAAGLLPDPQLAASADHPGTPGYSRAWSLGFSEDLSWLLTRSATLDAARAQHTASVLQLAWQGWLLSQRTAADYVDLWAAQQRMALLQRQVTVAQQRDAAYARALARRDVTLENVAASLITLASAQSQLAQAEQAAASARAALDADLGVMPQAHYTIVAPQPPALPDAAQLQAALTALPHTRPDLLALRAAAQASDAQFRAAVLAQFPALTIGLTRASDTSRVQSTGLGISLSLPLFGSAQVHARRAGASRDQAYAQYQARLDEASGAARALAVQLHLIAAQRAQLTQRLPQLHALAAHADRAFAAGALNGTTWASVQQNLIARELELIDLAASLSKGQVALAALLGRVPPGAAAVSNTVAESQP